MMKIGEIAKKAQVNIQTLRYYEKRGIIKPSEVKNSGYRFYTEEALKSILFIKHAKELGFSLDQIKELLDLRIPSKSRCQKVRTRALEKLNDVQEKIEMLKKIKGTLKTLIKDCESNKTSSNCPIIESMETNL